MFSVDKQISYSMCNDCLWHNVKTQNAKNVLLNVISLKILAFFNLNFVHIRLEFNYMYQKYLFETAAGNNNIVMLLENM